MGFAVGLFSRKKIEISAQEARALQQAELSPGRLPAPITATAAQGTKGALARPRTLQPRPSSLEAVK